MDELQQLNATIQQVKDGQKFVNDQTLQEAEKLLADYECWLPLFELWDSRLTGNKRSDLDIFLRKIKVEIVYFSDNQLVAKRAQEIVRRFHLTFNAFRKEVLVFVGENWFLETDILQAVCGEFAKVSDRVKCLERICSLYEKKIPDERLLDKFYHELIEIDSRNIKALKYFKMIHSQNFDWDQVIDALRRIIAHANRSEAYRAAQELAAVYLYSKNEPQEALRIIDEHCADSPLDKSTILHDIYTRLGDWSACISLLQQKLASEQKKNKQAELHIKIAKLQDKRGRNDLAVKEYEQALTKDFCGNIDALETVIVFYIQREEWVTVVNWLDEAGKWSDRAQLTRIEQLKEKIADRIDGQR